MPKEVKTKATAETLAQSMDRGLSPEDIDLLRRRAKRLAEADDKIERQQVCSVIAVTRRDSIIGLPVERVREIRKVRNCRLQGLPAACLGVFQIRGQGFSMIDLRAIHGDVEALETGSETLVALLTGPKGDLGLRIDGIIGPREIFEDELDHGADRDRSRLMQMVTTDLLAVLDIDELFIQPEVCGSTS